MKNKKLILGVFSGIIALAAVGVYLDARKIKEIVEEQSKSDEKEAIMLAEKRYEKSLSAIEDKNSRYISLAKAALEVKSNEFEKAIVNTIECTYQRRIEKIKQARENGEDLDALSRRLDELEDYIDLAFKNLSESITSQN